MYRESFPGFKTVVRSWCKRSFKRVAPCCLLYCHIGSFCCAVCSRFAGALACEGVQALSNELTVAEAEEYCRYAFCERNSTPRRAKGQKVCCHSEWLGG